MLSDFGKTKLELLKTCLSPFLGYLKVMGNNYKDKEYEFGGKINLDKLDIDTLESIEMNASTAVKRYSALGSKSIRPMDLVRSSRFRKLICYIPVLIHPLNMHHSCSAYPIPSINIFANIPYLLAVHRPHKLCGHNCQ